MENDIDKQIMGILDKIGKVTKKVGEETKKATKTLSLSARETQLRKNTKRAILERFTYDDLEKIMVDNGLEPPKKYEKDPVTGKKIRTNVTKRDFIKKAMQVPFEEVVAFARRTRIGINDILEDYKKELNTIREEKISVKEGGKREEKELYVKKEPELKYEKLESQQKAGSVPETASGLDVMEQSDFEKLMNTIEKIPPCSFGNEKEFQQILKMYLTTLHYDVILEYPIGTTRVDLLVEGKYALEVKLANIGSLRNAIGQLWEYKDYFSNLGIVVVDAGGIREDVMQHFINEYRKMGVKVAIVRRTILKGKRKR